MFYKFWRYSFDIVQNMEVIKLYILAIAVSFSVVSSATTFCSNLPSGLGRLRNGVDVTKLDLLPLDARIDNGFRTPVIDFTCTLSKTIKIAGNEYEVPDQVISIDQLPSGWLNANINIYKSSSDVTKTMSLNANVDVLKGLFSASGSYKSMQNTLTNSSKYIEEVTAYVSARKVNIFPYWGLTLSSPARLYIEKFLPPNINSNVAAYKRFIEYFGTHFFQYGKYGGSIRLLLRTDKSYFKGRSEKDVEAQAKGSFFGIISAGGGGGSTTTKVDTRFTQATTKTVKYFGGDTNLLSKNNGIPTWQPTVSENPWLFGGKLVPIYNFFTDNTKKKSMQTAIDAHLDLAYLQELQRLLYSFKGTESLQASVNIYKKQVKDLLTKQLPDHAKVRALGDIVENNINIPSWYSHDTKLCYRWYPDGDGGQCGGPSRLLCSNPGEMTPYYRDDSDRRGGGCRMSWGITKSGVTPSWFDQVQICYQWWPDGDGGQCGGGVGRLLCANVGSYTSYYRDDTDRRGGGCRMQWKLVVPSSAPLWMQNAKLCFQWYPDGDGGQCGGGVGRNLCANANEFTAAYRDDTDRRGGGCQMSWGIRI